jgi:hypothetical protein
VENLRRRRFLSKVRIIFNKEIRVPNQLVDGDGQHVKLKPGAEVDVKIEAEPAASTVSKTDESS